MKNKFFTIVKKVNHFFFSFLIILSFVVLALVSWFLYNNFYQTIASSKKIVVLRQEVALEEINIDKFEKLIEEIEAKTSIEFLNNIKNPFIEEVDNEGS